MAAEGLQPIGLAIGLAIASAPVACASGGRGDAPAPVAYASGGRGDAPAPPAAGPQGQPALRVPSAPLVPPAPSDMSVSVGGGFWSPRLGAVEQALRQCAPGPAAPAAPPDEQAIFGAIASLSLDGRAFLRDVPATCASSCVRPAWTGADARGCSMLATLASLRDLIWRVDGGDVPAVTAAFIADSELSFTVGDVRWNIDQGTDYPWSSHVGFTVSHRGSEQSHADAGPRTDAGATAPSPTGQRAGSPDMPGSGPAAAAGPATLDRALSLRLHLPEWVEPAAVRVSARGRMLAAGEFTVEGRMLTVRGTWADGDRMHVSFPMLPRRVPSEGGVEVWRGPLRYVAEAADQRGSALADMTIAASDGLRDVPLVLGPVVPAGAGARQANAPPAGPVAGPAEGSSAAPNGIIAVMVERRARGLPDLVLVPIAFAGNRGDMPRVGTFTVPAP